MSEVGTRQLWSSSFAQAPRRRRAAPPQPSTCACDAAGVVKALAKTVERAVSLRPGGDRTAAHTRLLFEAHAGGSDSAIPDYLEPLDLDFRFPRLAYVEGLLDQIAAGGRPAQDLLAAAGVGRSFPVAATSFFIR